MSLYTKLNDETIRQIAQNFDIESIISWKLLQGGAENTNHLLITKNKKYVLTLCERKTAEETLALAKLLQHLENKEFNSSQIILNKAGSLISFYEHKPVLLKMFIEGDVTEVVNKEIIFKIGQNIAKLHLIPPPDFLPHHFSYGAQTFGQVKNLKSKHPFVIWLDQVHHYIQKNLSPDLPKALIHGDVFPSNVVIAENNEPVLMDFEETCYYYRLFDIGMAITGLCRENGQIEGDKANALIQGYQAITPLLSIEKEKLNAFIVYAATATAFWRFRQFNIYVPKEELKDHYLDMQNVAQSVLTGQKMA